ncbi:MAG: sodium:solute symporter family protein [Gemmatimonadota bacterium]
MTDQAVVFAGVLVYLVVVLLIGVFAARQAKTADDFLVAGRSLPVWLCGATVTATFFGSGTVIGAAGAAYEGGLLAVIADPFGAALCVILAGFFFVRMLRRMRLLTVTDLFEIRYGTLAGMLSAIALMITYIGWTGAQLVAFGFVLHTLTGISTTTGMMAGTVIVLAYTSAGGMWAVALTDFVQIVILFVGLAIMLPLVLSDVGGWAVVAEQLPEHTFRLLPLERTGAAWLEYVRAWAIIGLGSIATQDLLQRALSSRDERVAQNAFYLAGFAYLTVGMIPVILGLIGAVTLPGLVDPEFVVPQLALEHLHPIALAVFVGALLAAIMSSADSALLAPATLVSANIVPFFKPDVSEKTRLMWARCSIPAIGVCALWVALRAQTVYDLMLDAFSVNLVGIFVPFAAAIWWSKANRAGALAAMFSGTATWAAAWVWAPDLPGDLMGMGVGALLMVAVSLATQRIDPPRPLTDIEGRRVGAGDRLGTLGLGRVGRPR